MAGGRQKAALALIGAVGSLAGCDQFQLDLLPISRVADRGDDQHLVAALDGA